MQNTQTDLRLTALPQEITPSSPEDNPWITFFDAMDTVPRDENWELFVKVMRERPLNRLPVERDIFAGREDE